MTSKTKKIILLTVLLLFVLSCAPLTAITGSNKKVYVDTAGNTLDADSIEAVDFSIGDLDLTVYSDTSSERLPLLDLKGSKKESIVFQEDGMQRVLFEMKVEPFKFDPDEMQIIASNADYQDLAALSENMGQGPLTIIYGVPKQKEAALTEDLFNVYQTDAPGVIFVVNADAMHSAAGGYKLARPIHGFWVEVGHIFVEVVVAPIESTWQAVKDTAARSKQDKLDEMFTDKECEPDEKLWGCLQINIEDEEGDPVEGAHLEIVHHIETNTEDDSYTLVSDNDGKVDFAVIPKISTPDTVFADDTSTSTYHFRVVDEGGDVLWDGEGCEVIGEANVTQAYAITIPSSGSTTCEDSPMEEWGSFAAGEEIEPAREPLAQSLVGAKATLSYTRAMQPVDGPYEEQTVTRYEEIVEALDDVTVKVKISYEGDASDLMSFVDDISFYQINLETGEIIKPDSPYQESLVSSQQVHKYQESGIERRDDGWEFIGEGTKFRYLQTYLPVSMDMLFKTYDPEGTLWGTYTDTMESIDLILP